MKCFIVPAMNNSSHFQSTHNLNRLLPFIASAPQVDRRCEGTGMGRGLFLLMESPDFLKGKIKSERPWKNTAAPCPDANNMKWPSNSAMTTCRMIRQELCDTRGWARGLEAEGTSRPYAQAEHRHGGGDADSRNATNWNFRHWGLTFYEVKCTTKECNRTLQRYSWGSSCFPAAEKEGANLGVPEQAAPGEWSPLVMPC